MNLTPTYIDSQTLGEAVRALEAGDPSRWTSWNTKSILVSTCVLISVPELRISPSARLHPHALRAYVGTPGNYGIIGGELGSVIKPYMPDRDITTAAARTVRQWADKNKSRILESYVQLKTRPEYGPWIDYESSSGWETATLIINGIVDEAFLLPISNILTLDKDQAREVLLRSRDQAIISQWLQPSYKGADKEIAKSMFTIGALLRGRYHDRVAERSNVSIIHHPLRSVILKDMSHASKQPISTSNTMDYLAKIIVAASLNGANPGERVRLWCANVKAVRNSLVVSAMISLPADDISDDAAMRTAVRVAQDCSIRTYSKTVDNIVHHAVGLGAGAATSLLLHPWMFPIGYYATEMALNFVEGHALTEIWSRSTTRLSSLARRMPGRLNVVE